jgi:hypothetical protein
MSLRNVTRWLPAVFGPAGVFLLVLAWAGPGGHADALVNCDVDDVSMNTQEQALIQQLNEYRAANGAGALTQSVVLTRAAHWMANDLANNAYFSHIDSLGRSGYQRSLDCGYPQGAGENLAGSIAWDTATSAMTAWKNSPGHNQNMLLPFYTKVGVARVYKSSSLYGYYWVAEFGVVEDPPAEAATPVNTSTPAATATQSVQPTATTIPATPTYAATAAATPTDVAHETQGGTGPVAVTPTPNLPLPTSLPTPAMPPDTPLPSPLQPPVATPFKPDPLRGTGAGVVPVAATAAPVAAARSVALSAGANLVTWPGEDTAPWNVVNASSQNVAAIYSYDATVREWRRYSPRLLTLGNTLTTLRKGEAYWVIASGHAELAVPN